jgi:hypothetical protein
MGRSRFWRELDFGPLGRRPNDSPAGHLFPGRGKEASERYEKSMEAARLNSGENVSNPLAIGERDQAQA